MITPATFDIPRPESVIPFTCRTYKDCHIDARVHVAWHCTFSSVNSGVVMAGALFSGMSVTIVMPPAAADCVPETIPDSDGVTPQPHETNSILFPVVT